MSTRATPARQTKARGLEVAADVRDLGGRAGPQRVRIGQQKGREDRRYGDIAPLPTSDLGARYSHW